MDPTIIAVHAAVQVDLIAVRLVAAQIVHLTGEAAAAVLIAASIEAPPVALLQG